MKKTIAIIGAAGNAGSAIALGLAAAGNRVLLADEIERHPLLYVKLLLLEYRIRSGSSPVDVEIVLYEREACWEADIIVVAVRSKDQVNAVRKIRDVVTSKIVITMMNSTLERRAAEGLARLLPYSKIVTVRHRSTLADFKKSQRDGTILDVFVSGVDQEAVSLVMQLLKGAGYRPRIDEKPAPSDPRSIMESIGVPLRSS